MGFIYHIKYNYPRKSAENLFSNILAQVTACMQCPCVHAPQAEAARKSFTEESRSRNLQVRIDSGRSLRLLISQDVGKMGFRQISLNIYILYQK